MKLATIDNKTRDGQLVVVNKELTHAIAVQDVAATLQEALDNWTRSKPQLEKIYNDLNKGNTSGAFPFEMDNALAPLPRAYQWLDGSIYHPHLALLLKAAGMEIPNSPREVLRMYQGASDEMLGCHQPFYLPSEDWEVDFEAEVGIITDDVPMGISAKDAKSHIQLIVLLNDVSIRDLQAPELKKAFGFIHGKPATSFTAVAVTPDELGNSWDGEKLHLPILSTLNGKLFGWTNAGQDMAFKFTELIAHAAKTRNLGAGTIIGSGTVSNAGYKNGSSCISERRALETVEQGAPKTPFMKFGDRIQIDMQDATGKSIFGAIDQVFMKYQNNKK